LRIAAALVDARLFAGRFQGAASPGSTPEVNAMGSTDKDRMVLADMDGRLYEAPRALLEPHAVEGPRMDALLARLIAEGYVSADNVERLKQALDAEVEGQGRGAVGLLLLALLGGCGGMNVQIGNIVVEPGGDVRVLEEPGGAEAGGETAALQEGDDCRGVEAGTCRVDASFEEDNCKTESV
jgi:hypothetical protein